jgi:hypothetical protein
LLLLLPLSITSHHASCRTRARLPNTFTAGIDRLHQLTRQAAGKQQLRMNSDSLPGSSSSSSPAGSPLRTNVYGFSQVPYTRIPHMLLDKVMEVGEALRCCACGHASVQLAYVATVHVSCLAVQGLLLLHACLPALPDVCLFQGSLLCMRIAAAALRQCW